jgi:molecular chaperone GrpE (heat shock protein)
VLGKPFDGTTMNAIGTVESTTIAAGYVAEQISPCYRWKSAVLRFADVRVAQPPSN